jgi:hypothetical protein
MTLTAGEIDTAMFEWDLKPIADQAKRVPVLEAERDRYRKVAELARRLVRHCLGCSGRGEVFTEQDEYEPCDVCAPARAALAVVGMKVEE